ncbi:MAG: DNA starvation/stationary phase protection protein [Pseudomonadota bacterium]
MSENEKVVEGLNKVLSDTYALYVKTHGYHWNVTGPRFHTLHTMFEEQYTEMWASLDDLAERLRALDAPAPGSSRGLLAHATIEEGDNDIPSAEGMIQNLISDHEKWLDTANTAIDVAVDADDSGTEDMLAGLIAAHEKTIWMLKSSI